MQVARRSVFAVCAILQLYNILHFYDTVGKMKAFKKAPTVAVTTPLLWNVYDNKKNKDFDQFSWLFARAGHMDGHKWSHWEATPWFLPF